MKKLSFLFLSLIISVISTQNLAAATIHSIGTIPGTVTCTGTTTTTNGGGVWTATTTWLEGTVPTASDSVVIVNGDLVLSGTISITIQSLTIQSGGKFFQQIGMTGAAAGFLTLEAGSWWYGAYGSATKIPGGFGTYTIDPASNWVFTSSNSSTLINGLPATYGNVYVYKTGSILAGATIINNINIQGNLTINNGSPSSAVKGSNTKSSQVTTIHVGGNVNIISGVLSGVDAPVDWTASNPDGQTCTWNIDGNVTVGDASTASGQATLACVSSADAGLRRTGIFNITGDLSYINGAKFEPATNNASTNTSELAVINLYGNLSTDATVVTASNTVGTFQINFLGNSTKTLTLGAPTTQMAFSCTTVLRINKTSGDVQLGSPLTIDGHVTLTLTSGKLITTSSNVVTISGTGAITTGSVASFVNGPMISTLALGATPTVLTFPIGKGLWYRPLSLNITQDSAKNTTYMAEVFNQSPTTRNLPGTLTKVSTVEYWNVSKGSGANVIATSVTLNYQDGDGVTDIAHLRIAKDDGAGNWVDLGGTGSAPVTGNISSTNAFTTFGDFTLTNAVGGTNDVPVELTSFTALAVNNSVSLQWSTATENQNSGWNVERSKDNKWEQIGFVRGHGNSFSALNYSFIDKTALSGNYTYRLKQIDYNGTYKYSKSVEINVALPVVYSVQNYPNPFNPSTVIRFAVPVSGMINISVFNPLGEKVATILNERVEQGVYERIFNGNNLATGVYIYRLTADNFTLSKKMILMK